MNYLVRGLLTMVAYCAGIFVGVIIGVSHPTDYAWLLPYHLVATIIGLFCVAITVGWKD